MKFRVESQEKLTIGFAIRWCSSATGKQNARLEQRGKSPLPWGRGIG